MTQTSNAVNLSKPETDDRAQMTISAYSFDEVELPQVIEKPHEKFITYGRDNLYPDMLIDAWLQSSTHSALVNGIVQMIAGAGLEFDETILDVELFRNKINKKGETLDDLIAKTSFDLYLHGYFAWQVVWNVARTKIVEIYHTPAEQVRAEKRNDETNQIENYYISWDWEQYRKAKFAPTRVKAFDIVDRSEGRQMIFVKQYRPKQYYYSTPGYVGGMNWILLDNRIGEYHLNNIENGFFPSSIVQFFNGEPPPEKKRAIEQAFMSKFTGKAQAKVVFVYNDNAEQKVAFDTHEPANIDKRFKELMPEVDKHIMIAHRVPSPLLFGIRDSAGLGNNAEELESSSLLMNKMIIIPLQKLIIDTLKRIFDVNGWKTELNIKTLQPGQWLEGNTDDAEATTDKDNSDNNDKENSFSKQGTKEIPKELIKPVIKHLREKGEKLEDLEAEGYVLIQDDDDLTEEGLKLNIQLDKFANITSNPEAKSEFDRALYKIRYEYRGPRDEKNRDFCAEVLDLNLIYRKEDIDTLTGSGANPEFGNYSIWDYKGSYGCRHRWHRLVFFRKRKSNGQFMPNEGLENDKTVSASDAPAAVIPNDSNATTLNKNL